MNTSLKTGGFARLSFGLQWILFIAVSLVLYIPVIDNSFVSDDFLVLKKLAVDRQLNLDNFFRPLSDITLWLTYKAFGLNPLPYYLTGIILHALSALLVFRFCLQWDLYAGTQVQQRYALVAAALFLTYPFHNESVAWILGRGALMANTLGLAALLMLTAHAGRTKKIAVVCLCYFVGLTAYETIMPLPAMVLIYLAIQKEEKRYLATWLGAMTATLLLHLLMRQFVSGTIAGNYGSEFFGNNLLVYGSQLVKAAGRTVLPPSDNSLRQIILFCLAMPAAIAALVFLWKKDKRYLLAHLSFLMLAMIVPIVAGVSTRTSESDRFLHFPSYFFCMLLAFALVRFVNDFKWQAASLALLIGYQVFFLEKNNRNWDKASTAVRDLMHIIAQRGGDKITVVNLPEEIDGAFVFRNGFNEALMLHHIDTASVELGSRLTRKETPAVILPRKQNGSTFIPPHYYTDSTPYIVYWNKERWVKL